MQDPPPPPLPPPRPSGTFWIFVSCGAVLQAALSSCPAPQISCSLFLQFTPDPHSPPFSGLKHLCLLPPSRPPCPALFSQAQPRCQFLQEALLDHPHPRPGSTPHCSPRPSSSTAASGIEGGMGAKGQFVLHSVPVLTWALKGGLHFGFCSGALTSPATLSGGRVSKGMCERTNTDPILLMGKQGLRSQGGTLARAPRPLGMQSKVEPAGRSSCGPAQQPGRASRESVSSGVLPCVGSQDPPPG